jgi:hypothetical protein
MTRHTKKTAGALALLTALATGAVSAPAASASPRDTRECVTRGEYSEIREGMSVLRVKDIFDQRGIEINRSYGWMDKEYFTCTGGSVTVTFKHSKPRRTWVMKYKYADWY